MVECGSEHVCPDLSGSSGRTCRKSSETDQITDRLIVVVTREIERHQNRVASAEEVFRHDTDNAMRLVIEQNRRANRVRRTAEPADQCEIERYKTVALSS